MLYIPIFSLTLRHNFNYELKQRIPGVHGVICETLQTWLDSTKCMVRDTIMFAGKKFTQHLS